MNYAEQVKSLLWADIRKMSACPGQFVKNPDTDFTRKRKLDFENLMRFLISMESGTTGHELLKYFEYDINNVLTNSVFTNREKSCFPKPLLTYCISLTHIFSLGNTGKNTNS